MQTLYFPDKIHSSVIRGHVRCIPCWSRLCCRSLRRTYKVPSATLPKSSSPSQQRQSSYSLLLDNQLSGQNRLQAFEAMSQADAALPPQHQRVTRQVSFAAASQRDIPAWTSSGSSTSSGRTAVTWINTFATPSPPSKPESFPYRLGGVLSFPRRLFSPPSCDTCYAVGNAECGQAVLSEKHAQSNIRPVDTKVKIGKPRSFKKTPLNRVQLKEILEK